MGTKGRSSPSGPLITERIAGVTIADTSIIANQVTKVTVAVPGLIATDIISGLSTSAMPAGLGFAGARVSAADTLEISFVNPTAGNIPSTALSIDISVNRFTG